MAAEGVIDRAVEELLRRDRRVVVAGLILVTILAWTYLYFLAMQMGSADMIEVTASSARTVPMSEIMKLAPWTPIDAILMLIMWAIMMVGMMVPSATPVILLYARVVRKNAKQAEPLVPTGAFFSGYLIIWVAFSAAATSLQFGLEQAALLSPMMSSTSPVFGGLVLLGAAIYQWTPYKDVCLRRCRSPVWFLSTHWGNGTSGALRMGLLHGAYCLGCCWMLMLILFVGGVMNLLCIAVITIFVFIEKVMPRGREIGRGGAVLVGLTGIYLITS